MAERTITGLSSGKVRISSATSRILSAVATEDPPNFITILSPEALPSACCLTVSSFTTMPETDLEQLTRKALLLKYALSACARRSLKAVPEPSLVRDPDEKAVLGKSLGRRARWPWTPTRIMHAISLNQNLAVAN
ncbi:hypothetical protein IEQ34_008515 [Dendrobium chrysotoxum]|uniref:Uncharacterized protein n=1 Tax=Dendrobium chrysotoxum TaxID=161865 RepID=A0AAV7H0B2_DENCH|nr:hypothetical protein IEQ34_008515 [Dendrobium chrysotoxum]